MAKEIIVNVLFSPLSCWILEHQLHLLRSELNFLLPYDLGDGKFQEFSREVGKEELKEKAPSSLFQSPFIPGNLNAEVSLLKVPDATVCEGYSPSYTGKAVFCSHDIF